jgi:protease I
VFQQGMEAVCHTVHVVCPDKKVGDRIKTSLHDFEGDQTYTKKLGHYADINKTFSEVRVEEYDAVYAAGGRGPEYIRTDKRIQDMVRHFHETGKPIFTICHGVQIPMAVPGLLKGRKVAGLGACVAQSLSFRRAPCLFALLCQ